MEYFNKITWIVIAKDRNKKILDQNLILLDEENVITKDLNFGSDINDEFKSLSSKYIKYNEKFVKPELVDVVSVNKNNIICEIIYISVINYITNVNKAGTFYSLEELETRNIKIDERYGKHIRRRISCGW